LWS
jgi:hypothetical protein